MNRFVRLSLVLLSLLLMNAGGCTNAPTQDNLIILLPNAPRRDAKLTINGREQTLPVGSREWRGKIALDGDAETLTIVYDFWPYAYSNTIRTRQVKLAKGQQVQVDLQTEDASQPDMIKPIYYPTPPAVVDEMCKMAAVGKDDVVYDIGCGDGRLVITAVKKFGAKKGVGVDLDPERIAECQKNAREAGVLDRVEFRTEDALKIKDLSDATVVLLYVGEDFGRALEPVLRKTLRPGARVVSHRFPLGNWRPDVVKHMKAKNNDDQDEDYVLKLWTIKK